MAWLCPASACFSSDSDCRGAITANVNSAGSRTLNNSRDRKRTNTIESSSVDESVDAVEDCTVFCGVAAILFRPYPISFRYGLSVSWIFLLPRCRLHGDGGMQRQHRCRASAI